MHALNDTTAHSATAALRVEFRHEPLHALLADPRLLAVFGFGDAVPAAHDDPRYLHVALPAHGDAPFECWRVEGEIAHGRKRGIAWSSNGALQFGALEIADAGSSADIETAAAEAYARLHDWLAQGDHPHPLRIWNYLDAIILGDGDHERYRQFCVGRVRGLGPFDTGTLPAATAVGSAVGSAMPMSSLARIISRRAMNRGSSPAVSIRAR